MRQCHKVNKKGHKSAPFWWFLLRGISYPRLRLGGQCELFVVCVYVVLLFTTTPVVLSTLLLFALSKLCIPIKKTLCYPEHIVDHDGYAPDINPMPIFKHKNPFGGDGGIRTPVQNTFLSASYSNNCYLLI